MKGPDWLISEALPSSKVISSFSFKKFTLDLCSLASAYSLEVKMGRATQPFRRGLVHAAVLRVGHHLGPQGGGIQLDRCPRSLHESIISIA